MNKTMTKLYIYIGISFSLIAIVTIITIHLIVQISHAWHLIPAVILATALVAITNSLVWETLLKKIKRNE